MLREALGRRGLFKRLGMASLLAASGQENIARLSKVGVGSGVHALMDTSTAIRPRRSFTSALDFATWWKEYGKHSAINQVRHVDRLDPDIAAFRLPLSTKVRMQSERNYAHIKAHSKADFLRRIFRFGSVDIWGDDDSSGCSPPTATYAVGRNTLG